MCVCVCVCFLECQFIPCTPNNRYSLACNRTQELQRDGSLLRLYLWGPVRPTELWSLMLCTASVRLKGSALQQTNCLQGLSSRWELASVMALAHLYGFGTLEQWCTLNNRYGAAWRAQENMEATISDHREVIIVTNSACSDKFIIMTVSLLLQTDEHVLTAILSTLWGVPMQLVQLLSSEASKGGRWDDVEQTSCTALLAKKQRRHKDGKVIRKIRKEVHIKKYGVPRLSLFSRTDWVLLY